LGYRCSPHVLFSDNGGKACCGVSGVPLAFARKAGDRGVTSG
jgi:hypothetical protein